MKLPHKQHGTQQELRKTSSGPLSPKITLMRLAKKVRSLFRERDMRAHFDCCPARSGYSYSLRYF